MSAMPMLAEGAIVVFDQNDMIVGYVFVEPLAKPAGSQLQRWILREPRAQYRFRSWTADKGAPASLGAWKSMALTPTPARATWGATPSQGLWVAGATYVVAQATPVIPAAGVVPTPKFPRHQAIIAHTLAAPSPPKRVGRASSVTAQPKPQAAPPGGNRPSGLADLPHHDEPTPQVILGDYVLRQLGEVRGYCFGDLVFQSHKKDTFFESIEYALLGPQYLGAGSANTGTTVLDAGGLQYKKASQFHDFVLQRHEQGARYEVTGCNYYCGAAPPPEWFL